MKSWMHGVLRLHGWRWMFRRSSLFLV
jgi:hypothetical protein